MIRVMQLKKQKKKLHEHDDTQKTQIVEFYSVGESYINPDQVSSATSTVVEESKLPQGLDSRVSFTELIMESGQSMVVVGRPSEFNHKVKKKKILYD